jgi:hypothetical protein
VRFVLGRQRADEAEQAGGLGVAVAGGQRGLGDVPLLEIGLQQAAQQVFLGRVVVSDAAARDAADLDEFVEGQGAARAVAIRRAARVFRGSGKRPFLLYKCSVQPQAADWGRPEPAADDGNRGKGGRRDQDEEQRKRIAEMRSPAPA